MKFLLKLLVVAASLVALFLIMALFVDRSYKVERSNLVNVSNEIAFDYLVHLENQEDYGVWFDMDPNMKVWYEGNSGEVGSKLCWSSKNEEVGTGEQEIIAIDQGKRIDFKLRFFEPQEMESDLYLITKEVEPGKSKIIWGMSGEVPYPWNIMLLFMSMEDQVGKDLKSGLKNMETILEKENQL